MDLEEMYREIITPFEELGIDQIFVDEADMFKNLGFQTNLTKRAPGMPKVVGISTSNARRSRDMYLKTKLLTKMHKGGGIVFATGTPISNTLNEIFTMQKYLDFQALEEKGIYYFDGWAGDFTRGVPGIELSTKGTGYDPVIRLKLTNLQSLIKMFKKFADIKMPEDLPHLKRPKLKGDARTVVQIEPSQVFENFLQDVVARAEAIHSGTVDPSEDNFLKITSDLRKASLDMRLIDPSISESEAGAKLAALCDAVKAKYKETSDVNGTQLIFSDIGVPKGEDLSKEAKSKDESALEEETSKEDIAVYKRIKDGLIQRGIPANQIAFVHEAKNAKQRQALFDRVNTGEIRVIIGSTGKMGAGTNFQKHLVALHHLDCPWRPRDIEQREGRILRAGNQNAEVEIFTYVTKGSYDANMWEKVMNKKSMMDALLRGDPSVKEMMDISIEAAGYGDIKTMGLKDPLIQEQSQLSTELQRLRYLKHAYATLQREKNTERKKLSTQIQQAEQRIKNIKADIAAKVDTKGDAFKMKIGSTEYTKRAEAGKTFDKLIDTFDKTTNTKVGEIGGFDINVRVEHTQAIRGGVLETISKRIIVTLSKRGIYSVDPSLKSIEHFISQGIEKLKELEEKTLERDKARVKALDSELAKPFDKQAELTETEKRLDEVNRKLDINNKPTVVLKEQPEETTTAQIEEPSDSTEESKAESTQEQQPESEQTQTLETTAEQAESTEETSESQTPFEQAVEVEHPTEQLAKQTKGEPQKQETNNEASLSTTNDSTISTEHKAWQKNWDYYRRISKDNFSNDVDKITDYCETNIQVGDKRSIVASVSIDWGEDADSGRIVKLDGRTGKYSVSYSMATDIQSNLSSAFEERLKNIADNVGAKVRIDETDKLYFEFDNYKDATGFATTIKSELQRNANENADTLRAHLAQKEARKVPPPKWERHETKLSTGTPRIYETAKIGNETIQIEHTPGYQTMVRLYHFKAVDDYEQGHIEILANGLGGEMEIYPDDYKESRKTGKPIRNNDYHFKDYESAKEFANEVYKSHIEELERAKNTVAKSEQTPNSERVTTPKQETATESENVTDENPDVKSEMLADKNFNTFNVEALDEPEIEDNTARITVKKNTNGTNLYYLDGKRIAASKLSALENPELGWSTPLYESKSQQLTKVLESYNAQSDSSMLVATDNLVYKVTVHQFLGDELNTRARYFETLEDAVACAKHIYRNKGNLRIKNITVSNLQNEYKYIVHIDAYGNGTFTNEAAGAFKNEDKNLTSQQINEAAKNPDTANALEQLGAKVDAGKVSTPDAETQEAVESHIKTITAWHGSPNKFDEFSLDEVGTGEGTQSHGWGLYFSKGKKTAERYKQTLSDKNPIDIFIDGQHYAKAPRELTGLFNILNSLANISSHSNSAELIDTAITRLEQSVEFKKGATRFTGFIQLDEKALDLLKSGRVTVQRNEAKLYKVTIPSNDVMLDEQKTFSEQPSTVQTAVNKIAKQRGIELRDNMTGKHIYRAISDTFSEDLHEGAILASKLLNDCGVKGLTYLGKKDGRCYVVFDDKAIKILEKFSKRGNGDTTIINFVNPKDLTPLQKMIQSFGKKLGVRVVFFRNTNGDFHGAHANGITYINVNSKMPLGKVFWHESMHWLKANNPKLYQQLVKVVGITDDQRRAYLNETGRKDLKTRAEIDEEIISDQFFDAAKRTGLLQSIAGKDRSLIERVVQWLKDTMNKFIDHFRNPQGKFTTAQAQAFAAEFGKVASELRDENGKKIFRYNRRTGNIEAIGRRSVFSSTKPSNVGRVSRQTRRIDDNRTDNLFDEKALASEVEKAEREGAIKYSFAGIRAKTSNQEKLAEAQRMEAEGKSRDDIFKETGWFKGKDGKWRFEIPDNLGKISFDDLLLLEELPLGELYDNPKLYKAYPQLKNVIIQSKSFENSKADGTSNFKDNTIILNTNSLENDEKYMKSALIHEIQHFIQFYEGFAVGGTPESSNTQIRNALIQIHEEINKIVGDNSEPVDTFTNAYDFLQKNERRITPADKSRLEELFERRQNLLSANFNLPRYQSDLDKYKNLGGEQEAEVVRGRALKRSKSDNAPTPHSHGALIVFGGKEYAMASMNEPETRKTAPVEIDESFPFTTLRKARETFKQAMLALKDVPILNKSTGIVAQVGKEGRSKPLSSKAIDKSLANGFSIEQHFTAAMNIKKLYENAWLDEEHADKNNAPNVLSVKRFHCETTVDGEKTIARITLKEIDEYGHRIYTIELQELDKPAELENRTGGNSSAGSESSTITHRIADPHSSEEPSGRNIPQTKFAGNGNLEKMFAEAKFLTSAELNGQQRKWIELGKSLGLQVKWMDAHTDLKGALKNGVIYLNRRANDSVAKTFYHELFHLTAALKPELYQDLLKYFSGNDAFSKEQLDAYRAETKRHDLTDEAVIEEILSDNFGQVQKRVKLMQEMSADNPNLAKRLVAWLKYMADKIAATFRNPEGGMTTAQRDAFIKGIADLADKVANVNPSEHTDTKFSGSISNSAAKLRDKIQNVLTATKNERPHNHMRKLLEKLSGYQIKTGHIADGIDILVKDISKVIRTRNAYDWERILPEIGGMVAQRLNLNPSADMKNYIASWLMDGEPNNTSQVAKDFQKAMRNADDMYRDQLLEVQSIFHEWNMRPAEQIVRDTVQHGKAEKSLSQTARDFFDEGYEQFVEELYPVKQLVDELEKDRGKKLKPEENPFTILRNFRGVAGRAKIMIEEGTAAIDALRQAFPNIDFNQYKTPFKTIRMILESVDALDNIENRKQLSDYLLACSVKDLHRQNDANLRRQYELREKIDTLEEELDSLTDKSKIKATEKRIDKLKKELKVLEEKFYATPFSEKVCDGTIAKYKDKYGEAQRDIIVFQWTLLDIMVDSGLLSEDQKLGYIKNFPNHVPMFRAFDENESKSFGDSLKAMTGSTRDVIDPLESIVKNTYDFIRRAEKNKAKCLLANLAREGGAGSIIEERKTLDEVDNKKPDVGTVITFFENGEKKYLETDRAVVKAVNNLTIPQMSWFMKLLRVGTMLLRNFATVYNPAFAFRNLAMDNQNAFLYSKYGWWSPADFVRGFLSVWNRDADYQEWMAMGGAQASFWSVDRDYTQASLDRLREGRWGQTI